MRSFLFSLLFLATSPFSLLSQDIRALNDQMENLQAVVDKPFGIMINYRVNNMDKIELPFSEASFLDKTKSKLRSNKIIVKDSDVTVVLVVYFDALFVGSVISYSLSFEVKIFEAFSITNKQEGVQLFFPSIYRTTYNGVYGKSRYNEINDQFDRLMDQLISHYNISKNNLK